ncbi:MAG TPA: RodZ domain-containing protein [Amaricoccus sp.]|nr:RodZ domain-containing protein [Amaricoccus sp.]
MSTHVHTSGAKRYGPYEYALGDELRGERASLGKTLLDIQRDLRIKAAYIAAIEDAKPEAFPNPGFIAGYVRSYARYLGLDPDEVFWRFCQESGFQGATQAAARRGAVRKAGFDMPLARHEPRRMAEISLSGIGSVAMLVCLLGGLGYGGWMVLQNIQRVQFAPVEATPQATATLDTLQPPATDGAQEPTLADLAAPVAATSLADLYRQQELEVPILVPRDGPIAALDPDDAGPLAARRTPRGSPVRDPDAPVPVLPAVIAAAAVAEPEGAVAAAATRIVVVAERAAWTRVYLANGTVIFERILEKGETYSPPDGSAVPLIWAGNSGSVYVRVGGELRGPLGRGTRAAKDISLDPVAIAEKFPVVTEVPEVISQAFGEASPQAAPLLVQ